MVISFLPQLLDCVPSREGQDHPFLAYSPMISVEDSSEPFRAFLGAMVQECIRIIQVKGLQWVIQC
jgi:hypothetical protein